jgi:hypothetical protein
MSTVTGEDRMSAERERDVADRDEEPSGVVTETSGEPWRRRR